MNIFDDEFFRAIINLSDALEKSKEEYVHKFIVYQDTFELHCENIPILTKIEDKFQICHKDLIVPVKRKVVFNLLSINNHGLGGIFKNRIYLPDYYNIEKCPNWFIEWDEVYLYKPPYKTYENNICYDQILETGNLFKKDDPYETRYSLTKWLTKENMSNHMITTINAQKIFNNIELLAIEYL